MMEAVSTGDTDPFTLWILNFCSKIDKKKFWARVIRKYFNLGFSFLNFSLQNWNWNPRNSSWFDSNEEDLGSKNGILPQCSTIQSGGDMGGGGWGWSSEAATIGLFMVCTACMVGGSMYRRSFQVFLFLSNAVEPDYDKDIQDGQGDYGSQPQQGFADP